MNSVDPPIAYSVFSMDPLLPCKRLHSVCLEVALVLWNVRNEQWRELGVPIHFAGLWELYIPSEC